MRTWASTGTQTRTNTLGSHAWGGIERAVASAPSRARRRWHGMVARREAWHAAGMSAMLLWSPCASPGLHAQHGAKKRACRMALGRVVGEWWEPCRHEVHVDRAWGPASFACRAAVSATREITQQSARPPRAQAGRAGALSQSSGSESSRSVGHGTVSLSMTFRGWRGLVCLDCLC